MISSQPPDWRDLYEWARTYGDPAAGFYNDNIRVETRDGPVNVRIPIHDADTMDLRPWREDRVLTAIAPHVTRAPLLLHTSVDPPFQVQEFIAGDVFNDIAPLGVAIPSHVENDVVRLFTQLTRVPGLPGLPAAWPNDGDTTAFAHLLSDLTQHVFDIHGPDYADLFRSPGFPADPLEAVNDLWDALTPRPFACVHADLHRRNMIAANGETTFIDWELTLWGGPVYDLAAHIHKMAYLPEEQAALITRWQGAMPADHVTGLAAGPGRLPSPRTHQVDDRRLHPLRAASSRAPAPPCARNISSSRP